MKWYVGSSSVQDRVFVIEDGQLAEAVSAQRSAALEEIEKIEKTEMSTLVDQWRQARKESDAARDTARAAYDKRTAELNIMKGDSSVLALVNKLGADGSWQADLERYSGEQKQWELDRINARNEKSDLPLKTIDEIAIGFAGVVSGEKIYIYHPSVAGLVFSVKLLVCVVIVTIVWVVTTLVTKPTDTKTLRSFYRLCHPGGPGWRKVVMDAKADGEDIDQKNAIGDWKLPIQILCVFLGCIAIYSSLFSVGNFVYGNMVWGFILAGVALAATIALFMSFGKTGVESGSD
jgi:hypothetical protein